MKKRIITLFLALTLLAGLAPAALAADHGGFADVSQNDWFYKPVQWAVENGITKGISNAAFGPDVTCTRGQVVTFLWAAANRPEPAANNPFTDVTEADWFYKPVLWAVENGITSGMTPNSFGAYEPCTRAQVVTFLWAAADRPEPTANNPFTDVSNTDWFCQPVLWAVEKGITSGLTPNSFGAGSQCTRGQIVTFLYAAENPSDDPIEIPPAKPNINEKEIYTAYLLNGGYDALTGRNTKYNTNKALPVTIFADFDGNGIKDLSISFTNRAWFSKGYLHEYQGLYTIDPSTKAICSTAVQISIRTCVLCTTPTPRSTCLFCTQSNGSSTDPTAARPIRKCAWMDKPSSPGTATVRRPISIPMWIRFTKKPLKPS